MSDTTDKDVPIWGLESDRERLRLLKEHDRRGTMKAQLTALIDEACKARGLDRLTMRPLE